MKNWFEVKNKQLKTREQYLKFIEIKTKYNVIFSHNLIDSTCYHCESNDDFINFMNDFRYNFEDFEISYGIDMF